MPPPNERPMALLAELTYRCPLKCPYCSNPIELARYNNELDTQTWLRVIREAAELGVIQIHFSGGEPLVRADLTELIAEARRLDLYSNLSTGAMTATEKRIHELARAGLDAFQVSLLDPRPDKNDWLAGAKSFEQKRAAIVFAKQAGLPITLNVVLHRHNLDRIEEVLELALEWEVEKIELAHVQYTGWAFKNRAALLPTREQLERAHRAAEAVRTRAGPRLQVIHVLPDYYQSRPKACLQGWGRVFMTVAPDGAVLPCQTAREIPGLEFPNVREESLEAIWDDAPVFKRFRGMDWMPEPCRSCEFREVDFGGCRCQAFLLTGDAGKTDPVCHFSPDHGIVEKALEEATREAPPLEYRVFAR